MRGIRIVLSAKNQLDEKMALSDSSKDDFEHILWTAGTQNVNMQQNMFLKN